MNPTSLSRLRILVATVAVLLVVAGCSSSAGEPESLATAPAPSSDIAEPEAGEAAAFPDFVAATAGGGQIDFGSLEGQDTVLWFWAPW